MEGAATRPLALPDDRPLPQNRDAEAAVLGSVLTNEACLPRVLETGLKASDFTREFNGRVFDAILSLAIAGKPIDILTIKNELRNESVEDRVYVSALVDGVPDIANVERYARIVKELADDRRLISFYSAEAREIWLGERRAAESTQRVLDLLLADDQGGGAGKNADRLARDSMARLDARLANPAAVTGINTGYELLNLYFYGHQRGEVMVIAGRSTVGKTTVAWNLAAKALDASQEIGAAYFAYEMTMNALEDRILSMMSGVKSQWIKTGLGMGQDQIKAVVQASAKLAKWGKRLYASASPMPIGRMVSEVKRLKKSRPLDLVFIDYLQLIEAPGGRSREEEISKISKSLLYLAKDLDISVIAMSQSNRMGINKDDRATANNMRESDAIFHDARKVIILDRPRLRDMENKDKRWCDLRLFVDKNSEGPMGEIPMHFDLERFRMEEAPCNMSCRHFAKET